MLNLPFYIQANSNTYEIRITQGSYLVNPDGSQGTHNQVGIDNAAIDFRRAAGDGVFSFLDGVVIGAFADYTDARYPISPVSGPATFGNYVTVRYNSPDAGGVFFATFAHISQNSAKPWLDLLKNSPNGIAVSAGEVLGRVASLEETPYSVHLHVSFARTLASGSSYATPHLIADSSVNPANAELLGRLTIDGLLVADAVIGDSITGNGLGFGAAAPDRFVGGDREDFLRGFGGNDTLVGGDARDTLEGGSDNDYLDGGAGSDLLVGGAGNDVYSVTPDDIIVELKNEGIDAVWVVGGTNYVVPSHVEILLLASGQPLNAKGNELGNTMVGNGNANFIEGLGGDDQLDGGVGGDTLIGGRGRDTLHGGKGSDDFRFDSVTDSNILFADLILDFTFSAGERDRINLSAIDANSLLAGNQAFVFIGSAVFSGDAGQLRVTPAAGLGYAIAADTNGDRSADMVINVQSSAIPSASWFVL